MPRPLRNIALIALAAALAGCATTPPPTQVTRFHLGQPIAPAAVTVEPRPGAMADGLEYETYADAVARGLSGLGFRPQPGTAKAELLAVVDVARGSRETVGQRSPFSIGLGGGTFSGGRGGGLGVGGSVSFPIGKPRDTRVVTTELAVQLKRRSEGTVIWEGRARTEARIGTPEADPRAAADKLAAALFAGFPGESGRTITVK